MINRLLGRAPEPRLDPALGNPEAQHVCAGLAQGDWKQADAVLSPMRDWDLRELVVAAATEQPGRPEWIDAWTSERPDSPSAWLVRGAHTVQWAWEARGARTADQTEESALALFHLRLAQSEAELNRAAEMAPSDPTPHVWRLVAGRGLELSLDDLWQRFKAIVRLHPEHRFAHNQFLQTCCRKWGGSDEQMFEFARDTAARAPVGSSLNTLIAEAHIERWAAIAMFREGDLNQYFRQPAVQSEIQQAADRYLRSAQARVTPRTPWDRNIFLFCYVQMGDAQSAQAEFSALGPLVTTWPWQYLGRPLAAFGSARRSVGIK